MQKVSSFQRVAVFVDVQNMFYSAKHLWNAKLNFTKLMEIAVNGRQLVRAFSYIVENAESDQTAFIEMLQNNGYEVKSKELRTRADGSAKGDWDMGIAIEAISMAPKVDCIVLVSGDGDFLELVLHLKAQGVRVETLSFIGSTNEDLIAASDYHFPMDDSVLLPGPFKRPSFKGFAR
jgi:uncharacterized LabA/DUF88 family protein